MTIININLDKIENKHVVKGEKGEYLNLIMFENKNGPDQFGNDGFVVQGVSKEDREKGIKGQILGNFKHFKPRGEQSSTPAAKPQSRPGYGDAKPRF